MDSLITSVYTENIVSDGSDANISIAARYTSVHILHVPRLLIFFVVIATILCQCIDNRYVLDNGTCNLIVTNMWEYTRDWLIITLPFFFSKPLLSTQVLLWNWYFARLLKYILLCLVIQWLQQELHLYTHERHCPNYKFGAFIYW